MLLMIGTVKFLPFADQIIALAKDGTVTEVGTFEELRLAGGYVHSLVVAHQDEEAEETQSSSAPDTDPDLTTQIRIGPKPAVEDGDKRRQLGDFNIYRYYFGHIGVYLFVLLILFEMVWSFFSTFPSKLSRHRRSNLLLTISTAVWLKFWTDDAAKYSTQHTGYYLGVYSALQVAGVAAFGILVW
jgi:hypothetical protein